jgi:hypothetical protein
VRNDRDRSGLHRPMGSALTDDRTPSFQRLNPDHYPACTAEGGTVRAILDTPTGTRFPT